MAAHGKLEQFHVGQEDWDTYKERLQQYFVANNVKGAKKQRAILLSVWASYPQGDTKPHDKT